MFNFGTLKAVFWVPCGVIELEMYKNICMITSLSLRNYMKVVCLHPFKSNNRVL